MRLKLTHQDPVAEAVHKVLIVASATQAALDTLEAGGAWDGKLRRRVHALQKCLFGDAVFEQGDPEEMRRFAGQLEQVAKDECRRVFFPDAFHARGGDWQEVRSARGSALHSAAENFKELADALEDVQRHLRAESLAAALRG